MSKTLTVHNIGKQGQDWFTTSPYGQNEIKAIIDPIDGNTQKIPTSIPSPFSHFELVKTAFRNINESGLNNVKPLDFKIVSDTLDVGEIFFNLHSFDGSTNIIPWDKNVDLPNLLNSADNKHKQYGEVLKLFLDQDSIAYNFNLLNRLFILEYNNGIIGGTSPATLFFASPNNINFARVTMPNNDTLFDDQYCHLYDRDKDYQLFWFALQTAMPNFSNRFNEVNEYLDLCKKYWKNKDITGFFAKIQNLDVNSYFDLHTQFQVGNDGNLEILGFPLMVKTNQVGAVRNSDFKINSKKIKAAINLPLVLSPSQSLTNNRAQPMTYWANPLTEKIKAKIPYQYDTIGTSITDRRLPGIVGVAYPCIFTDDFLEPYLIRLVYPINSKCFYNGGIENSNKDYLLPIKEEFFKYFDSDDVLTRKMQDNKPMFEMKISTYGNVEVTLRIPIQNNEYVEFKRNYEYYDKNVSPKPVENKGVIIEHEFGLNIFPFVRYQSNQMPDYRVMLVDRDINKPTSGFELTFLDKDINKLPVVAKCSKRVKTSEESGSHYYVLDKQFDFIQVETFDKNNQDVNRKKGILIPLFTSSNSKRKFNFAIDFGTTNTHIEYSVDGNTPMPFEIGNDDIQVGTLHDTEFADQDKSLNGSGATDILSFIDDEFVPLKLSKGNMASFPQRTILGENLNINFNTNTYILGDFNLPFPYEKRPLNSYKITTNLKWQNYQMDTPSERRVSAFFEMILFLIKAKVILNSGDLDNTKIIWTYPSSMTPGRLNKLSDLWEKAISKYIGSNLHSRISESIAPYYFYKTKNIFAGRKPLINIDIGGGTTDIMVYENDEPQLLSSFRFAANSIFGDGFTRGDAKNNGFIKKYFDKIMILLKDNQLYDLERVAEDLNEKRNSEDIIAFFFSLEENPEIIKRNLPISFHDMLKNDDEMRIIFLIFYASIIYYLAKQLKGENLKMPRYITLSGRGSKVLDVLTSSTDTLQEFSKTIIKKVYNEENYENDGLTIITEEKTPKEVTCKGALEMTPEEITQMAQINFIDKIKVVWSGVNDPKLEPQTYEDINDEVEKGIMEEIKEFINFLFDDLDKEFSFNRYLNVSFDNKINYKEILTRDIENHLLQGLKVKKVELNDNLKQPLEETLFFYHFIPALSKLASEIQRSN